MRIVLLLLLLVAALGARLGAQDGQDPEEPVEPVTAIELPVHRTESAIVREPQAKIDFDRLAQVKDATRTDQLVREPDAYVHLLAQARTLTPGDLEALGMRPLDQDEIAREPAKWRGHAFEVKGTLETVETVTGGEQQEIRGTILDRGGRRVAFTVLRAPDVEVGQVVRLRGFFFKLLSLAVTPGEYADGVVCLVGRDLVRSFFPSQPVADLSAAGFEKVTDTTREEMLDLQEDVLFPLLEYARSLSPEQRAAIEGNAIDVRELERDPAKWHGKIISFNARYLPELNCERRLGPGGENPLDVHTFHEGILIHAANRKMRWISTDPFPLEAIGEHGLTVMTGVFVKMSAWESVGGSVMGGPLFIPIRFDPYTLGTGSSIGRIGPWFAGSAAVIVALLFWFMFRDRREAERFRHDFLSRKRTHSPLAAAGTAGVATPATPEATPTAPNPNDE